MARSLGLGEVASATVPRSAGCVFVRDLFGAVLPRDRELVRRTAAARHRHRSGRRVVLYAVGAGAAVVCGLLPVSFVPDSPAPARLAGTPCLGSAGFAGARPPRHPPRAPPP